MIHLDTHAVVWLFEGRLELFPPAAQALLRARRPVVSPTIRVELTFLHELGRLTAPAVEILDALRVHADLGAAESTFERVAAIASGLGWTRDPFDRLIAAHALADDVPLLTRDARMLAHCPLARWG